jgi:hypothetical protein
MIFGDRTFVKSGVFLALGAATLATLRRHMRKPTKTPMKKTLIAAITACSLFAGVASALAAGTIPVAIYNFDNPNDINSFQKLSGGAKCTKKLTGGGAMGISVGDTSPACTFRTSVIADSDDLSPSFQIQASVSYDKKTPATAQRKLYLSVFSRASTTGSYELRIVPSKQKWYVLRDRDGAQAPQNLGSGTFKKIKAAPGKANTLVLQTFEVAGGVSILGQINGRNVYVATDTEASPPHGRFNGVGVGSKTGASALGMLGTFDGVTVSIPRNF